MEQHGRRQDDIDLSRRMDTQDTLLREIRDMVVSHIAEEKERKRLDVLSTKALAEIVLLWRASKIIIPALIAITGTVVTAWVWAKDHIR